VPAAKPHPNGAFYFVSHQSSFTGGNYTSSVQKNYQLNVAQFRELYARGKADRAEGRTQAEASEYAQSIRDQLKKMRSRRNCS
jgi:hypothetical protein